MEREEKTQASLSYKTPLTCDISPTHHILSADCQSSTFAKEEEPLQYEEATPSVNKSFQEAKEGRLTFENIDIQESRLIGLNGQPWVGSLSTSKITCHPASAKHAKSNLHKLPLRGSSAWPTLSSLRVMGSFRKLRSTVLQGIQSREDAVAFSKTHGHTVAASKSQIDAIASDQRPECTLAASQKQIDPMVLECNATEAAVHNEKHKLIASQHGSVERPQPFDNEQVSFSSHSSRMEGDHDDDEEEHILQRNTRCSRSLRIALSAGRILPLSTGVESHRADAHGSGQQTEVLPCQPKRATSVLHRLSRSTDNLHLFSNPFRRSNTAPQSEAQEDFHNIHRTASSSSVELTGSGLPPWRIRVHKVVSGMTELSAWRRAAPHPQAAMKPLSVLHDAYSRRVPCIPGGERLRRPSPAHAPPVPTSSEESTQQKCLTQDKTPFLSHRVPIMPATQQKLEGISLPQEEEEAPAGQEFKTKGKETATDLEDLPHPALPLTALDTFGVGESVFGTETTDTILDASDVATFKASRVISQPLSNCGWPRNEKFSTTEKEVRLRGGQISCPDQEDRTMAVSDPSTSHREYSGGGHQDAESDVCKRRPFSVIGGPDLYSTPLSQPEPRPIRLPYSLTPYRKPGALSQSTPTGLDRMGRGQVLHRVHSAGAEVEGSVALEESAVEEGRSFGEPCLRPDVELAVLSEWICSGLSVHAEALWDHVTLEERALTFKAGDVIRLIDASDQDWWWGAVADQEGWFPSSFVRVRVNQDPLADSVELTQAWENPVSRDTHLGSMELRGQMRANVVKEIMSTERIYLKHLKDICEGYVRQCRRHVAMFNPRQLVTIFGNIEDIYKFHRNFLKQLERNYNQIHPHLSEIGSCFLLQGEGFSIYSEYCNNHPRASAELHRLMKLSQYRHFFEACRLLQQMIDISLPGFLLTPVQKICKYPLQLGELLKYTSEEHRDYESVSDALKVMKKVACLINERKRRLENIDAIAQWQLVILHWEGDDILDRSSELIHSGELIRMFPHGRTQRRTLFLFDHQLIFCKKDLLRRDLLHYQGRLDMDRMDPVDLADGQDAALGSIPKHAIKLLDRTTGEAHILCCRKLEDKRQWLEALARERQRVREDKEMGIEISESQRKQAILNARRSKRGDLNHMAFDGCALALPHQPMHPLHQRHVTVPTRLPQQRVISLAEPRHKPFHLWHSFTHHTRYKK